MRIRATIACAVAVVLMGTSGTCGNGVMNLRHTADSPYWPATIGENLQCWEWQTPDGMLVTIEIDNRTDVSGYYVTDSSGDVVGRMVKIDCKEVRGSRTVYLSDGGSSKQTRRYRGRVTWPCQMWPILPGGKCKE